MACNVQYVNVEIQQQDVSYMNHPYSTLPLCGPMGERSATRTATLSQRHRSKQGGERLLSLISTAEHHEANGFLPHTDTPHLA
jgi:hypothetical protein